MSEKSVRQQIIEALARRVAPDAVPTEYDEQERPFDFEVSDRMACLMDQIESGASPILLPAELDLAEIFNSVLRKHGDLREDGLTRDGREPEPCPVLTLKIRLEREKVCQWFVDDILKQMTKSEPVLSEMAVLRHFGVKLFLEFASEYFAQILEQEGETPEDEEMPDALIELHEADPDLITRMVAATESLDRCAGSRLREMIHGAVYHPVFRDKLGFLTAAAVVDRLEA